MTTRQYITSAVVALAAAFSFGATAQTTETVSFVSSDITLDYYRNYVGIYFNPNTGMEITAFQCDITIPESEHFLADDNGKYITGGSRLTATHVIEEQLLSDHTLRVIIYSTDNAVFTTESTALFSYTIESDKASTGETVEETITTNVTNILMTELTAGDDNTAEIVELVNKDYDFTNIMTSVGEITADKLIIYAQGSDLIVISPKADTLQMVNAGGVTTPIAVSAGRNVFNIDVPGVYIVNSTKVIIE